MTVSLVGVIYNTTTGKIRSIIIPEAGDGLEDQYLLDLQKAPPAGSAVATIAQKDVADFRQSTLIDAINTEQKLGLAPQGPCVLVDGVGNIVEHIVADPIHITTFNGHAVIDNSLGAVVGDIWDGISFQRNYAVFDKTTGIVASKATLPLPQKPLLTAAQDLVVNMPTTIGAVLPGFVPPKVSLG